MIAVITSTLLVNNVHSFFSDAERLQQTLVTISKLEQAGFDRIFLFDNSLKKIDTAALNASSSKLSIHQTPQYTFKNKGLNEALLLLNNIHILPPDVPVFKISGRYYPSANFNISDYKNYPEKDFVGVGKIRDEKLPYFNTRAYFVKNKEVLELMLNIAVEEMISYAKGIHGLRSLYGSLLNPKLGTKYQLSLEQVFARILEKKGNFHLADKINIEGYVAGAERLEFIEE